MPEVFYTHLLVLVIKNGGNEIEILVQRLKWEDSLAAEA